MVGVVLCAKLRGVKSQISNQDDYSFNDHCSSPPLEKGRLGGIAFVKHQFVFERAETALHVVQHCWA